MNARSAHTGARSGFVELIRRAECQAQINNLRDATASAVIAGKNAERERARLVKILTDAPALLSVSERTDASKQLGDDIGTSSSSKGLADLPQLMVKLTTPQ